MASLEQIRIAWSGVAGGPGVTTLYSSGAGTLQPAVLTWLTALKPNFPSSVNWTVPNTGYVINSATGIASSVWTTGTSSVITGTGGAGAYPAPAGAVVNWRSAVLNVHGHEIRGKTFLVPLITACYQSDGTLDSTSRTNIQNACTTLSSSGNLVVYRRPTAPGATDGVAAAVTAAVVPDKAAVLRSRRD